MFHSMEGTVHMSNEKIKKILKEHSIPFLKKEGRIYADSMLAGTKVYEICEDLTGYTNDQLYCWLGY